METLLEHLVQITGHRDHALLDISVITAIRDLTGATEARVLGIFRIGDEMFIRPLAWTEAGKILTLKENPDSEQAEEPLANLPALAACIDRDEACAEQTTPEGIHILWFPVRLDKDVSACIEIRSPTPSASPARDLMVGILSVYRNYQSLLDYSERDSLTKLLNRKTFDDAFAKLLSATAVPDNAPLPVDQDRRQSGGKKRQWLAVLDIDHFKRVNDQFGHLCGDEVLILLANLLRSSFRACDRIFRFGGEEFVVLLRGTALDEARTIFERFRNNVERHHFPQVGQVTVSIGFSGISATDTPVVVVGHADQALYHAKTHGRNRVCYYDEVVAGNPGKAAESDVSTAPF